MEKTDYHWYRLDGNGRWSHKPGRTKVTNKDVKDVFITDPRTATSKAFPDYQFITFMSTTKDTEIE